MGEENEAKATAAEVDDTKKAKKPKADRLEKKLVRPAHKSYMQNRELSWLEFNKRVLDQSIDPHVPLLERLKFISIWRSNLQEFFMVRVGSLTDLELAKEIVFDSKTGMTPREQLDAVYARVRELTPIAAEDFRQTRHLLDDAGIHQLYPDELTPAQHSELMNYLDCNVLPLVSPQIINATHPFPHLENGALYIAVRLDEEAEAEALPEDATKAERKAARAKAAENVLMGIIPMPRNCPRMIELTGENGKYSFILLEHALEMVADKIFEMYPVKYANVIQVTRNADLDTAEESDEYDEDFRSHMQRILKKRGRLAPVRLESERPLSYTTDKFLREKLGLKKQQAYTVGMPLDMGYAFALMGKAPKAIAEPLMDEPASPQWPASLSRKERITDQVLRHDVLLSYPYETMDAFVKLLQEAAVDPDVVSIKITLYRLASQSRLAEALITAAENGKDVTALFELRARFDESNNIEWSQRFEQAGCNIIYGFHDYKVHSKICAITRRSEGGLQFITQLGTGNYNEKTAKLYTDLSMITADPVVGQDAARFFRSMQLESASSDYKELRVAPLMIKPRMCEAIDGEIAKAKAGKPARILMKSNAITDRDMIEKLTEASRAGVKITMLVRGISCLVPGIPGETENIRIVSVVGRLLEHSRIYAFGVGDETTVFLSSADLMTRNLDKRVEIAWPVNDPALRARVLDYFTTMLSDTAKLRELQSDGTFTDLCAFVPEGRHPFDAQDHLIKEAYIAAERARATGLTSPQFVDAAVSGTPATAPTLSSAMADMAEDAKEDFVTAEEIEQAEEAEGETAVEAGSVEVEAANEAGVEGEAEAKRKHAAVEANPASPEKAPLEIAIDDEPKKEDAQIPVEVKSEKLKADVVEKPVQASDVDAALEEVIAKIAETLDGDAQAAKQQTGNAAEPAVEAKKPAEAKAPATAAAPAATQAKKPQPAPTPKKKGFFARLFGR